MRGDSRRRRTLLAGAACLALAAAWIRLTGAVAAAAAAPAPLDQAQVVQELFLIGDAGQPRSGGEPVLRALGRDLARDPAHTAVVFLGDNLYPSGLPVDGDPQIAEMRRRLDEQVEVARASGAHAVMIPGNHDWEVGGPGGWAAIQRQQRRVEERGAGAVVFAPKGGCPGPEVLDVGERLRLVALDTQWWLQRGPKPVHPTSSCACDSEAEVLAALRDALEGRGAREAVVVAHHPLDSGGPHGGKFGLRQHLFPLTEFRRWAWLPLPLVGSAYPVARGVGIADQDVTSAAYGRMREAFASVLEGRWPLAWAAGHEHVLQVIESPRWGRVLVSGTGIYGHVTYVKSVPGSRYREAHGGYMRVDLLRDGRRHLAVIEVAADATTREVFRSWLE